MDLRSGLMSHFWDQRKFKYIIQFRDGQFIFNKKIRISPEKVTAIHYNSNGNVSCVFLLVKKYYTIQIHTCMRARIHIKFVLVIA